MPERAASLARRIAQGYGDLDTLTRFPTGLCHYVFDVSLRSGEQFVVRVAAPQNRHLLSGAVAWSELLRPLGVPLPALLSQDVRAEAPLPYLVLERLPGDDVGDIYGTLTAGERLTLARSVADVQRTVATIGTGHGYGYSTAPGGPAPRRSWSDVVLDNVARSGARLETSPSHVRDLHENVRQQAVSRTPQLDAVASTPFLDDLTTKNVLVSGGKLTGVVDVDVVCFGDPLYTPALTKVALVADDQPTDYVDAWLEYCGATERDESTFDLYCAVFCCDLLGEGGQMFNRSRPLPVERERRERLLDLLVTVSRRWNRSGIVR